jgi:DNA repair photolyase
MLKTIKRKTLLYKTGVGGMDYCLNHVLGCSHGCRYPCYAFNMAKSYGRVHSYEEWCEPKLVENALELLDKEIPRLKHKIRSLHLCFSTDPFMYHQPEVIAMSLKIIEMLNANAIPCSVLTKGVLPQELGDEKRFLKTNDYGISIVSLDENFRARWEPHSAPYMDRIHALKYLRDRSYPVWAHMEPYPTPNIVEQDIRPLLNALSFVGHLSFGGWNYNPIVRHYKNYEGFYGEQAGIVRRFCREHGIECSTF